MFIVHNQGDDRVVALRGDMDALPINEETGLEFSSVNPGVMHGKLPTNDNYHNSHAIHIDVTFPSPPYFL